MPSSWSLKETMAIILKFRGGYDTYFGVSVAMVSYLNFEKGHDRHFVREPWPSNRNLREGSELHTMD